MTKKMTTFYKQQLDTSRDGIELPDDAVVDSVDFISQGEFVNVAYHITREVEVDAPESAQEA